VRKNWIGCHGIRRIDRTRPTSAQPGSWTIHFDFRLLISIGLISFRTALTKVFLDLVDWASLEVRKIAGINDALAERREDIVYRVKAAGCEMHFYILVEHQLTVPRRMALRVLERLRGARQNAHLVSSVMKNLHL
jgi:hypothetical protein